MVAALRKRIEAAKLAEDQLTHYAEQIRIQHQQDQETYNAAWGGFLPPCTVLLTASLTRTFTGLDMLFDGDPIQLDAKLEEISGFKGRIRIWMDGLQQAMWLPRGCFDRAVPGSPRQWSSNPKRLLEECARRAGAEVPPRSRHWT